MYKSDAEKVCSEPKGDIKSVYYEKISWLCSMINCMAVFLECMSVISRSRLWSRIIVGANTTARFLVVIYMLLDLYEVLV